MTEPTGPDRSERAAGREPATAPGAAEPGARGVTAGRGDRSEGAGKATEAAAEGADTSSAETPEAEPGQPPVGWLPRGAAEIFGAGASAEEAYGLLTVDVPAEAWTAALETARDVLGCTYFDWLSAVDEPGTGFRVCAHVVALAGPGAVRRLLVRTTVPHDAPVLPTAVGVYAGAAWHERETHEMFGVGFTGHPHLVPLLLPEEFEGHPLRKDFVLAARVAKAWPGAKEPGESDHGGPKRRQMLPPGVPDPNEWGPLKGQLPPIAARPARGPRAAGAGAGERPARRTRSASDGSAGQTEQPPVTAPSAPPRKRVPDAPWEQPSEQPPAAEPAAAPAPAGPGRPAESGPAEAGPAPAELEAAPPAGGSDAAGRPAEESASASRRDDDDDAERGGTT